MKNKSQSIILSPCGFLGINCVYFSFYSFQDFKFASRGAKSVECAFAPPLTAALPPPQDPPDCISIDSGDECRQMTKLSPYRQRCVLFSYRLVFISTNSLIKSIQIKLFGITVLLRSKSLAQGPKEIYKAATECCVWIVAT